MFSVFGWWRMDWGGRSSDLTRKGEDPDREIPARRVGPDLKFACAWSSGLSPHFCIRQEEMSGVAERGQS